MKINKICDNDIIFNNNFRAEYDIESDTGYSFIDDKGEYIVNIYRLLGEYYSWSLEEIFNYIERNCD